MSEKTVAGKLASELAERNLQEAMKETSSFDYANFDMFEETDEKLATMIFNFLTGSLRLPKSISYSSPPPPALPQSALRPQHRAMQSPLPARSSL